MSSIHTDVLPAHCMFTNPVDYGGFDVAAARVEDHFDAWVFAARDAELALAVWSLAPRSRRGEAFVVYRAALDREERAATILRAGAALDQPGTVPAR
jgi:hypothetical protein